MGSGGVQSKAIRGHVYLSGIIASAGDFLPMCLLPGHLLQAGHHSSVLLLVGGAWVFCSVWDSGGMTAPQFPYLAALAPTGNAAVTAEQTCISFLWPHRAQGCVGLASERPAR